MTNLLDSLNKKNLGPPPIWLMRQAGRYMPSYQALRKKYGINEMFRERDLIVQTSLLPLELLNVDAAILFTDILTVLHGMNKDWVLEEKEGPVIEPLKDVRELKKREAKEVYQNIESALCDLKRMITCPLIGFAGGPLTIAAYLVEGKLSKDLSILKKWMYSDPNQLHQILEMITDSTLSYLELQIAAGVDVIQIFDSWAGLLSPLALKTFSLPYLKKIVNQLSPKIPIIVFMRGSCLLAKELSTLNPQAISFDWQKDLQELNQETPPHIAIQGNLDPAILLGSWDYIKKEVDHILQAMKGSNRYIFNLGHGILPQTPFDNVKRLVDYVKSRSTSI